jgi:hypothetical protein
VKFGLFYELQLPKSADGDAWDPGAERRIYDEMLEQVELADKVGFDYVFEVEHHFLEEYSHSSAPELMMAALSQRTQNIRLGHGIALTPPGYNHPARVADRGPPPSTSSPGGASSSAPASRPRRWSSAASASSGGSRRRCGRRPPARSPP